MLSQTAIDIYVVCQSCQVDVTSCWLGTDQQPGGEQRHAFSYRVRVTNLRDTSIQVLGRSWDIMDANGQLGECYSKRDVFIRLVSDSKNVCASLLCTCRP